MSHIALDNGSSPDLTPRPSVRRRNRRETNNFTSSQLYLRDLLQQTQSCENLADDASYTPSYDSRASSVSPYRNKPEANGLPRDGLMNPAVSPFIYPTPPQTEYFGFTLYLLSSVVMVVYLIWAYLPECALNALHIYYYPSRWWAVAIPSLLIMVICYIYVALACYNTEVLTRDLGSLDVLIDSASRMANERVEKVETKIAMDQAENSASSDCEEDAGKDSDSELELGFSPGPNSVYKYFWTASNGVWDLPMAEVCKVLYSLSDSEDEMRS